MLMIMASRVMGDGHLSLVRVSMEVGNTARMVMGVEVDPVAVDAAHHIDA